MPRHPLSLGATIPPIVEPPPPPPLWVPVTALGHHWVGVRGGQIPRFEHIYPQESGAARQFVHITPSIVTQ